MDENMSEVSSSRRMHKISDKIISAAKIPQHAMPNETKIKTDVMHNNSSTTRIKSREKQQLH